MKRILATTFRATVLVAAMFFLLMITISCNGNKAETKSTSADTTAKLSGNDPAPKKAIDTAKYDRLMKYLSNGDTTGKWPAKNAPYPLPGAVLPFNRVVAYYGNFYSKKMGALGEFPKQEMLRRLKHEVDRWNAVDTVIKSIPALHYICVTAQGDAGKDGKYRYRMPLRQIDTALAYAKEINGLVFIDVQVGWSTLHEEIPLLEKYLAMPNVHLGIDPEFALSTKGKRPGSVIGTYDAKDINYVTGYLADIVRKNNIPPKILIVHRFTKMMVTNSHQVKLYPEIQFVMDMDGWGPPAKKKSTYYSWVAPEPVQFTGFKLFYKNDTERSNQKEMLSPQEVLNLRPRPIYIQYQ
jgi:hypothetical protein